jgi:subtilisin family serine protease
VHSSRIGSAVTAARASGLRVVDTFDRVGVAVAVGLPSQVTAVAGRSGVTKVEPNAPITLALATSNQATRGEEAYRGFTVESTPPVDVAGVSGAGSSIAIVDSGIDGTHPMFVKDGVSKVVRNLKLACALLTACTGDPGDALDETFVDVPGNDSDTPSLGGHGTHVAGIAAGYPVTTSDGRSFHGAAPGASLVGLSVGQVISVYGGAAGMNWVLEHHDEPCGAGVALAACPPIRVVNNSWGPLGGGEFDPDDVVSKIQDQLVAEGVTVVWAAGNDGGDGSENLSNPPGQSPTPGILMVANYDDGNSGNRDNSVDGTSSRGEQGRPETYADVSAPGTNITSACRAYLAVCGTGFDTADPDYNTISGTSMAAPHVAGIVAQLLEASPTSTPGELEDVLEDTAHRFAGGGDYENDPRNADSPTSFDKGHGLVDVVAAESSLLGLTGPAVSVECAPDAPVVVDRSGDATRVITETPLPSEPSVDVIEGRVAWQNPAAVFTIKVADLGESAPAGTTGIYFDYFFSYGGAEYYLGAQRSTATGETFELGRIVTTRETLIDSLPGSFDPATDTITIRIPNQLLAGAGLTPLADGTVLSGFSIVSRRQYDAVAISFIPDADSADGTCPYTIGFGAGTP